MTSAKSAAPYISTIDGGQKGRTDIAIRTAALATVRIRLRAADPNRRWEGSPRVYLFGNGYSPEPVSRDGGVIEFTGVAPGARYRLQLAFVDQVSDWFLKEIRQGPAAYHPQEFLAIPGDIEMELVLSDAFATLRAGVVDLNGNKVENAMVSVRGNGRNDFFPAAQEQRLPEGNYTLLAFPAGTSMRSLITASCSHQERVELKAKATLRVRLIVCPPE